MWARTLIQLIAIGITNVSQTTIKPYNASAPVSVVGMRYFPKPHSSWPGGTHGELPIHDASAS